MYSGKIANYVFVSHIILAKTYFLYHGKHFSLLLSSSVLFKVLLRTTVDTKQVVFFSQKFIYHDQNVGIFICV